MISENRSFLQQAAPHLLAWVEGLVNKPSIELINGKKSVVLNNSVMYEDIEGLFADNFKNFIESPDAFSSTFTPHNFDENVSLEENVRFNCENIIGSLVETYTVSLPILHNKYAPTSQSYHTLLVLGSLNLLSLIDSLKENIFPTCFTRIAIIESSAVDFSLAFDLIDFIEFIQLCKARNIGLDLIVDDDYEVLRTRMLKYFISDHPLSLLGACVLSSPKLNPELFRLSSWFHAPHGLSTHVEAMTGIPVDDLNQLFQSLWTSLTVPDIRLLEPSKTIDKTVCLTASGPSLDSHIEWLKENQSSLYIIASGSSLLTLLSSGIQPNAVVLLERNAEVYIELLQLSLDFCSFENIDLFASSTLDSRIYALFNDVYQFHRPQSLPSNLFSEEKYAFLPQAGPHVVNAAIEIAIQIGTENLIMVGCDFGAVDKSKQRSSSAYDMDDRYLNLGLEGSKSKTVFSDPGLTFSADLCSAITANSGINIYRFGDGLPLKGVTEINVSELPVHLLKPSNIEIVLDYLKSCPRTAREASSTLSLLDSFIEDFDSVVDHLTSLFCKYSSWSKDFEDEISMYVTRINRSPSGASAFSIDLLAHPLFTIMTVLYSADDWLSLRHDLFESFEIIRKSTHIFIESMREYPRIAKVSTQWDPLLIQARITSLSRASS